MATAEKQSYPKTLWTATPRTQTRVFIPNEINPRQIDRTVRFRHGSAEVNDEREEQIVRAAMQNKVWQSDLTEPEIDERNAWVCYSSKAFMHYLKRRPHHSDPQNR